MKRVKSHAYIEYFPMECIFKLLKLDILMDVGAYAMLLLLIIKQ